ncbi:unknown [Prevotella sp. CAG:386]|nr:unknown [Prevotella sp. CAG:386]
MILFRLFYKKYHRSIINLIVEHVLIRKKFL